MKKGRRAIIIGATGLVGRHLMMELLSDDFYQQVIVLTRRSTDVIHEKLKEHLVNFEDANSYQHLVEGDVLFSCMGTTIKQAGSKEVQWKIDYTYQYEVAEAAKKNGVSTMVLVSSSGANAKSRIFYTRMKGELEEAIKEMNFSNYMIFQPSLLVGKRDEVRVGEKWGEKIMNVFVNIPGLKKYKPIKGHEVAKAMTNAYKKEDLRGNSIFILDELFELL